MADASAEKLEALGARARVQLVLAAAFAAAALAVAVFGRPGSANSADSSPAAAAMVAFTSPSVTRFPQARSLVVTPNAGVDYVTVSTDARLDAPVVATLRRGEHVDGLGEWVDSTTKWWMLVGLADGREGYVPADLLASATIERPPQEPATALMAPAAEQPTLGRPSSAPRDQPHASEPEISCVLPNGETQNATTTRCRALDGVIL